MSTTPLLNIQQLSFAYDQQPVLENVSLQMHRGDFLGLIGPNGGGKTTLLQLILGLLPLQQGKLQLFDENVQQFRDWPRLAYVAQEAGFNTRGFPVTVEEVLQMTGAGAAAISDSLNFVQLEPQRRRQLNQLSGGQRQRVFIARALVKQPDLLILDEPTVGVDHAAQQQFYQTLQHLNSAHQLSIILVSHEIDLVAQVVKQVACLNKQLVYHGRSQQLSSQELITKLYGSPQHRLAHQH